MKNLIITIIFLAMASMAHAGNLYVDQSVGATSMSGNTAMFFDLRITKMINDNFGLTGGGLIGGKIEDESSSIAGFSSISTNTSQSGGFVSIGDVPGVAPEYKKELEHNGIYAGLSLRVKNITLTGGLIALDYEGMELTTANDQAIFHDISGNTVKPFASLNINQPINEKVETSIMLMTYEINNDQIVNVAFGMAFKF